MDLAIGLAVAMIGGSVVIYIGSSLWFYLRWALGWRPKILDEDKVTQTVEECAAEAVELDAIDAEDAGRPMSDEQKRQHYERVQHAFRSVIERYIRNFST